MHMKNLESRINKNNNKVISLIEFVLIWMSKLVKFQGYLNEKMNTYNLLIYFVGIILVWVIELKNRLTNYRYLD